MSDRLPGPCRRPIGCALPGACRVAVLAVVASTASLGAQPTVTSAGLGYPVPPVDARAAGLGSVGVGLLGGTFTLRNPADLSQHRVPGINISLAPEGLSVEEIAGANTTGRERLSVVRAVLPLGNWAVGLGFGAELDQDWSVTIGDTAFLDLGTYPFEEIREQDGGVSVIDLSLSRRLGPVALGVSAQRLTGSVRRSLRRTFDAPLEPASPILNDVREAAVTAYRGWRFRAGASVEVADRFLLGGSYGLARELTADPQDPELAEGTFQLPDLFEIGASARIGRVLVAGGGGWTGWSSLESALEDVTAHDVTWAGGGAELRGLRLFGLEWPLRLSGRWTELPFALEDVSQSREVALGGGFGLIARGGLAELNATIELGRRGDLGEDQIEESFRRLTLSFTLRQAPPGPPR